MGPVGKSPFRKNSVRDKVFHFLLKPVPLSKLVSYIKGLGADPVDVLRYFRKHGMIADEKGDVRIAR